VRDGYKIIMIKCSNCSKEMCETIRNTERRVKAKDRKEPRKSEI
jgi:hypothetical protein